jgi:hypothetical protein
VSKTATIKLRLTEDEKANWETQAAADGVSLSVLIRNRMNHPVTRADGVTDELPTYGPEDMTEDELKAAEAIIDAIEARKTDTNLLGPAIDARRSVACEHGRPPYVFCLTCDE